MTDVELDTRVTALEENSDDGQNGNFFYRCSSFNA